MRRFSVIMLLAAALALLIVLPAAADNPQCDPNLPDYTPQHPACQGDDQVKK